MISKWACDDKYEIIAYCTRVRRCSSTLLSIDKYSWVFICVHVCACVCMCVYVRVHVRACTCACDDKSEILACCAILSRCFSLFHVLPACYVIISLRS